MSVSLRDRIVRALALRYRRWASARTRDGVGATLGAARATMRRKKYCLLATHGDGSVDARVVEPHPPGRDFSVWMMTRPGSRKAAQLRRDPACTLVYQDDARYACVVLVGRATLVDDPAECRARFRPLWYAFWPDGPESGNVVAIRFEPSRIEVWDAWRRVTPTPFGEVSAAVVRGAGGSWVRA
jgi:general stress protein 26